MFAWHVLEVTGLNTLEQRKQAGSQAEFVEKYHRNENPDALNHENSRS